MGVPFGPERMQTSELTRTGARGPVGGPIMREEEQTCASAMLEGHCTPLDRSAFDRSMAHKATTIQRRVQSQEEPKPENESKTRKCHSPDGSKNLFRAGWVFGWGMSGVPCWRPFAAPSASPSRAPPSASAHRLGAVARKNLSRSRWASSSASLCVRGRFSCMPAASAGVGITEAIADVDA